MKTSDLSVFFFLSIIIASKVHKVPIFQPTVTKETWRSQLRIIAIFLTTYLDGVYVENANEKERTDNHALNKLPRLGLQDVADCRLLELMTIPPDGFQTQSITDVLQRIAFNEQQIRFETLSNQPAIFEPESFRVHAGGGAQRFLRGKASFVHKEVQFLMHRKPPSRASRRSCSISSTSNEQWSAYQSLQHGADVVP